MINRSIRSITTLFALLICPVAFAQEQVSLNSPLTFNEAVQLALRNNISLKQQENQLSATSINKTSGLLQMGPSLSVGGNTGRNDGNSFNQQEGRVVNGLLDFTNASLRASMPLFQGFNQVNNYKSAKYRFDAQIETVERTKEDIIQIVTTRYLQCLLDVELVKIAERNVETQQQQLDQIRVQVQAGSRAEVEAFNQEYQLKNAELNLLRRENTLRNDKASLAETLQLDPIVDFELEEPSWDINQLDVNVAPDQLYTIAMENRSDLKSANYTESALGHSYQATKGNYYPSIDLFFNYGSAYNYIHGANNRTFEQQFMQDNIQKTYGISFSIPIFAGFATRSNVVQSKVLHENARLDVQGLELAVKSQVLLAYQNLQDAIKAYSMSQSQLQAANLAFNLGRERYKLGASNLVEYTQANQDFVQAQADFASARYTLMFQELLLDYSTGTLSFEDIE